MASIYANLWKQKKVFTLKKSSTPTGFVWEHQHGRRDVMWKRSIDQHDALSRGYKPRIVYFQTQ